MVVKEGHCLSQNMEIKMNQKFIEDNEKNISRPLLAFNK